MDNGADETNTSRNMAEQIVGTLRIGKLKANSTWDGAGEGEHTWLRQMLQRTPMLPA